MNATSRKSATRLNTGIVESLCNVVWFDGFLMVFYILLEYTTEKVKVFIETNMYG